MTALAGCNTAAKRNRTALADRPVSTIEQDPNALPIDQTLAIETFDAAWTMIHDTHFDPEFNGVDWDAVRAELRPRSESATTVGELRETIGAMLGRLGQSHFALLPREMIDEFKPAARENNKTDADPSTLHGAAEDAHNAEHELSGDPDEIKHPGDIGFDFRIIAGRLAVISLTPDGPASTAMIEPGSIITAIDGAAIDELLELIPDDLEPRMKNLHAWSLIDNRLGGKEGETVKLTIRTASGKDRPISITLGPARGELVQFGNLPAFVSELRSWGEPLSPYGGRGEAGVIWFNIWMGPLAPLFDAAIDDLRDTNGMILDLRGNPGGVGGMAMGFAGHFVNEQQTLGVMSMRDAKLNFLAMPRVVSAAGQRVRPYDQPLAILIDGLSGSTTEIFAGGMQSMGRARIFGEPSMGAALPALMDSLPNGDVLLHAFADFVTGTGVRLEGRGVIPDEHVSLTLEDLRAGRDPVMEAALQWLAEQPDEPDTKDNERTPAAAAH